MSSEWRAVTVEEIAAPTSYALATGPFGSSISAKHFIQVGVPVIRGANLSSDVSNRIIDDRLVFLSPEKAATFQRSTVRRGDLVFTCWGTINQVGLIDARSRYDCYVISNKQMKLTVDPKKADARFIYYVFSSPEKQSEILDNGIGSSVPGFNLGQLKKHVVLLPPLLEQVAIADFLESLDDRITLLREANKTLESIAQAVFKSWFVDFDPVRAKMEGCQPEGMDEATAALFPDSFDESELGLIPKGWKFSTVGESFVLTMGQSPPGDTYNLAGEGLPFYQGCTDFGFRFPFQRVFCAKPSRLAQAGDTLVSVRAPVGDVNMASEQCCIGRGVAAVRHSLNYQGFTFYTMKELEKRFHAYDSEGTVFGSISKKDFQSLNVVVPSAGALNAFNEITTPLDERIEESEETLRTLTLLRDTLLPRLISGQLRLPDIHQRVEVAIP